MYWYLTHHVFISVEITQTDLWSCLGNCFNNKNNKATINCEPEDLLACKFSRMLKGQMNQKFLSKEYIEADKSEAMKLLYLYQPQMHF